MTYAVIKAVASREGPQVQVVGTVDVEGGAAIPSNRRVARLLEGVEVVGEDSKAVGPDGGDAYVRALPQALKGAYTAEVIEE
jgi:hypothetical protein